jgi:DNA-binding FadR family transcriptional regulator
VSDAVFEQLRAAILDGRFESNSSLPAERHLCETFGVNRGAVREALQRLAQAGLVSIQQGGGTRVLDYRRTGGLDLLANLLFRNGDVDLDVARGVIEMRAAIAPDVARLCARRRDAAVLTKLEQMVEQMERSQSREPGGDLARLQALSLEFWNELVEGSENIAYRLAFNSLRTTYEPVHEFVRRIMADEFRNLAGYRALVRAIVRGDERAAARHASRLIERSTRKVLMLVESLRDRAEQAPSDNGEGEQLTIMEGTS